MELIQLLYQLLQQESINKLSLLLNVSSGTIRRWLELKCVPTSYEFQLLKLLHLPIDYSLYTSKQKDQFFTPDEIAKKCIDIFIKEIQSFNENEKDFIFIEPSAGNGSFVKHLPQERTIAMDIEPKGENIFQQDFLDWNPPEGKKYIVIGNPPFGLRGHLALQFINHAYSFADFVCFILPPLFESDGKGAPRKRVKYNLIYSEKLTTSFYDPEQKSIPIHTLFQIWSKHYSTKEYELKNNKEMQEKMQIYSLSDGGTISTTRNKKMIDRCHIYIPSTCFGKENMKWYSCFKDLPNQKGYGIVFLKEIEEMIEKAKKIEWEKVAFLSTNSAYNLRSSQIYSIFEK